MFSAIFRSAVQCSAVGGRRENIAYRANRLLSGKYEGGIRGDSQYLHLLEPWTRAGNLESRVNGPSDSEYSLACYSRTGLPRRRGDFGNEAFVFTLLAIAASLWQEVLTGAPGHTNACLEFMRASWMHYLREQTTHKGNVPGWMNENIKLGPSYSPFATKETAILEGS